MTENRRNNYYDMLEIKPTATFEEIRKGYQQAKNAYSGDGLALYSLMTKDECDKSLEQIEEAYSIISDPGKRQEYDIARGINQGIERDNFNTKDVEKTDEQIGKKSQTTDLTRKVAKTKYALDYKVDESFELEIEQQTEFSGDFLKKIREYKNVDLVRLSDMTRVSKTHLTNIESEDFEKLPAKVYVRGFVYQYAKCLKLNPDIVTASYLKAYQS